MPIRSARAVPTSSLLLRPRFVLVRARERFGAEVRRGLGDVLR